MTTIREEAIQMLEKVPEDKLSYVIQIMRGINGLLGMPEAKTKTDINREQFIMSSTEWGKTRIVI